MAISFSNIQPLTSVANHHNNLSFGSENSFPVTFPSQRSSEVGVTSIEVVSRENDALTSRVFEPWREIQKKGSGVYGPSTKVSGENEYELMDCWREIHGEGDWVGLLDPMDSLLRTELVRYGEMAQACYDGFDFDSFSKYCGSCKYPRHLFFKGLEMEAHGYEVTRYLYATSNINLPNFFSNSRWPKVWSKNANWIGYVAISNDEMTKKLGRRDIIISWRGTVTRLEWVHDLMDYLRPISDEKIPCPDINVKVESGFLDLYTDKDPDCRYCQFSAREQILSEVKRLLEMYHKEEVSFSITGHSLGSALAILSAYDIAETGLHIGPSNKARPICVFSFSGPRVGNLRFKERLEGLGVKVLRVVNVNDVVPKAPGIVFNENLPTGWGKFTQGWPWTYYHVGAELALDHKNSPFLKDTNDPTCAHNLEAHLHLLDGSGIMGRGKKIPLSHWKGHSISDKSCDFLKDHYQIPPFWRQDENRGMNQN
ncbi:Phospholipase A1-Igamma2 chloroplastic [Bienertia sinuspersici]